MILGGKVETGDMIVLDLENGELTASAQAV